MTDGRWTFVFDHKFPSDTQLARQFLEELLHNLTENGWPEEDTFGVHLATEEALMNAIKHGNQRDESKFVSFSYKVSPTSLWLEVTDEGQGFDPEAVPDPTLDENLEVPSGRGLMLMRTFMTSVTYNAKGNQVTMTKERTPPE